MKKAYFITFEGGEGSGKTTQSDLLAQSLENAGIDSVKTREPGGEYGAEEIRKILVRGDVDKWDKTAETLLFLAARVQHVNRAIKPALADGKWVICDRFHDSTKAYQGAGNGISEKYYNILHNTTLGNFQPDLTLLLDINPKYGIKRSLARDNIETRFEHMQESFHHKLRNGFLHLAELESNRIKIIDASKDIATVHKQVIDIVNRHFNISLAAISS